MLNTNWIVLLLGVVAMFALGMNSKEKGIKENFTVGMPQMRPYISPVNARTMTDLPALPIRNSAILGQGITSPRLGGDLKGQFVASPSYQTNIAPRFMPLSYGANIQYKLPDNANLGVPISPLGYPKQTSINVPFTASDFGKLASKENFNMPKQNGNGSTYCGASSYGETVPPNYKANQQEYNKIAAGLQTYEISDMVPSLDLTTLSGDGGMEQVRVIDRYMYANQKSRLQAQGDPIRGDLAIVPCNRGWFSPSVNPTLDLQAGALAVMGGLARPSYQDTWALQNKFAGSAGQTSTSIAGLAFDVNDVSNSRMTLEKNLGMTADEGINVVTQYSPAQPNRTNVLVTSFP